MTATWPLPAAACPQCGGPRMITDRPVIDPLRFRHLIGCPIRNAEDRTMAADFDRMLPNFTFYRPVTETELTLLLHLGYRDAQGNPPTPDTQTHVGHHVPGVRLRSWAAYTEEQTQ